MYSLIKRILFLWPAEKAHHLTMGLLGFVLKIPGLRHLLKNHFRVSDPSLRRELWGFTFPNPVGLSAGFDKDAKYVDHLSCFGFGFIEIGTVTPLAQPGNPKPRLFRLPKDQALINRMGFNNDGVTAAANRLRQRKSKILVGGNIGKNKVTANEAAIHDYVSAFQELEEVVDYFVVNVSSPNTPGLRTLQEKEPLSQLLTHLQKLNQSLPTPKPLLLKIAPDLSWRQLDDIIEIILQLKLDGIIATNTTISREGLRTDKKKVETIGNGGLSGQPLLEKSLAFIRYIKEKTSGKIPIIASGGTFTAADAKAQLEAGASLVQIYTGFIYEGPSIVRKICKGLLHS